MIEEIRKQIQSHQAVMTAVAEQLAVPLVTAVDLLVAALADGNKVLVMGNGGSAADAQHLAAEIVGRFKLERRGMPAIALTTDSSILTAVGNDYGFDQIFSRQVEALAGPGDVVIGLSTSGNSPNVNRALQAAREMGMMTIGYAGRDRGRMPPVCDYCFVVPSFSIPRIQETQETLLHIMWDLVCVIRGAEDVL